MPLEDVRQAPLMDSERGSLSMCIFLISVLECMLSSAVLRVDEEGSYVEL